jgi:amidophosphoribosyltransferase
MCGVVGVVAKQSVNQEIYNALTVLQHRGQDSSGIMTDDNGVLCQRISNGLVADVFTNKHMLQLAWQYRHWTRSLSNCRVIK